MDNKRCLRCKHIWISRTQDPVMCPRCKSYKWNDNNQTNAKEAINSNGTNRNTRTTRKRKSRK